MITYGAIAGAVLGLVLVVATGQAAPPQPAPAVQAQAPATERERVALALLAAVGNGKPTPDIVQEVVAWSLSEDGGSGALARNNPWNTTMCGFGQSSPINADGACGVGAYPTMEDGIAANAATLAQANFAEVRAALLANDAEGFRRALWQSPWAASHYGYGSEWVEETRPPAVSLPNKCPYTDTMQVGEGSYFDSTGSPYWGGQYGGMHLGVDLVGSPGDPVYAPFDMHIESVGEYTDAGRLGKNIQARFADGTLYYAGHLIDTYVQAGQTVPACTIIGTLGATSQPHTHIKLAGASAPVPCEGSMPGEYGCIDPLEYWRTH